jgi:hypothetical protein
MGRSNHSMLRFQGRCFSAGRSSERLRTASGSPPRIACGWERKDNLDRWGFRLPEVWLHRRLASLMSVDGRRFAAPPSGIPAFSRLALDRIGKASRSLVESSCSKNRREQRAVLGLDDRSVIGKNLSILRWLGVANEWTASSWDRPWKITARSEPHRQVQSEWSRKA